MPLALNRELVMEMKWHRDGGNFEAIYRTNKQVRTPPLLWSLALGSGILLNSNVQLQAGVRLGTSVRLAQLKF